MIVSHSNIVLIAPLQSPWCILTQGPFISYSQTQCPQDDSPETVTDQILNGLCYKNSPELHHTQAKLTIKARLDVFFWGHITAMVAALNIYLDPELSYSWQESSVLTAKAMGRGVKHA